MNNTRLARLLVIAAAGFALGTAPSAAFASGASGGGGSSGNPSSGGMQVECVQLAVDTPQSIGGALRWTGTATNCSAGAERIVLKFTDLTGAPTPGCALAPFSYGLPSQSTGQIVPWFMTSRSERCAGVHTEQIDAYSGSSSVPASSQTAVFATG